MMRKTVELLFFLLFVHTRCPYVNGFQMPLPRSFRSPTSIQLASGDKSTTIANIFKFLFKEITEDINELTGKEKWEPGDLVKWMDSNEYKYNFGDLTKWATGFASERAAEYVGLDAEKYDVANFGTSLVKKVRSGNYDADDIYTALRVMLAAGTSMGMLKNLPVGWLMELVDAGISKNDDGELMKELSTSLEDRIDTAMQDGSTSEEKMVGLVKEFTGKDNYSVGDIARVIMSQAKEKDAKPRTSELTKIVGDIKEWDEKNLEPAQ